MNYTSIILSPARLLAGFFVASASLGGSSLGFAQVGDYPVVDTGQVLCYDDGVAISVPSVGDAYYGQDSQYSGAPHSFTDNGDGTVTDNNTGLMWQQTPELYNKKKYDDALAEASSFNLAGYNDWRLPTVKELYSLMDYRGSSATLTPYIDTTIFDFRWGETALGERLIDTQYWSSTEYVGLIFAGDLAVFGVNFGDGRIKGYPRNSGPNGGMDGFVRYVRGADYGANTFLDNGDGTISDLATGLMWMKSDSGSEMIWEDALAYAEGLTSSGHSDWRLPNPKELQTIVDYQYAPDAVDPAYQRAAIDPIFNLTDEESWFWTGTTLLEAPLTLDYASHAAYFCFGQGYGVGAGGTLINVHGAGAQRSDPKSGNPSDWSSGFGPQNDQIRIFNYARAVRNTDATLALEVTPDPLVRGSSASLIAYYAQPGEAVYFGYCLNGVGVGDSVPELGGLILDLLSPVTLLGSATADASGSAVHTSTAPDLPGTIPPLTVHFQAVIARGVGGADSLKSNTVERIL